MWGNTGISSNNGKDLGISPLLSKSEITLTADDLSGVPAGAAEIHLMRYFDKKDLSEGKEVAGKISYNYYSAIKGVMT